MARLTLVRHGKSRLGFDEALNAELAPVGHEQAHAAAQALADILPPQRILSSPLMRATQSAQPLAERWGRPIELVEELTEIPSPIKPEMPDLKWRREWLNQIMPQRYGAMASEIESWRVQLYRFLITQQDDAVLFTHYLTINAAVGLASEDNRVVVCDPGYCGYEQLEVRNGQIYYTPSSAAHALSNTVGS